MCFVYFKKALCFNQKYFTVTKRPFSVVFFKYKIRNDLKISGWIRIRKNMDP